MTLARPTNNERDNALVYNFLDRVSAVTHLGNRPRSYTCTPAYKLFTYVLDSTGRIGRQAVGCDEGSERVECGGGGDNQTPAKQPETETEVKQGSFVKAPARNCLQSTSQREPGRGSRHGPITVQAGFSKGSTRCLDLDLAIRERHFLQSQDWRHGPDVVVS
jgi:hypothetical protein